MMSSSASLFRAICSLALAISAATLSGSVFALDDPTAPALPGDKDKKDTPPAPPEEKLPAATVPGAGVAPTDSERTLIVEPPPTPDLPPFDADAADAASERRHHLNEEIKSRLDDAKHAYKQKDYQRTIQISRNVLAADPRNVLAAELIRKAQGALEDSDEAVADLAAERRDREAMLETDEHAVRPPPRMPVRRPNLIKNDEPAAERRKRMNDKLQQLVTVDFAKADLEWVLNTLFILTGVNIIADQSALEGKNPVTLHVVDVPLKEVLNFIIRNNDGIQYSVTEDAIWVTASEGGDLKKIMYPRIYPLRYGLLGTQENAGGGSGQPSGGTGRAGGGGGRGGGGGGRGGQRGGPGGLGPGGAGAAGANQQEPTYIETVLKWMKDNKDPQVFPDGSDYLVDRESNQLIVYTTATGHERITEFLDAFDQPGIQVLIKARFLDISGENERSLGVNIDKIATRLGAISTTGGTTTTNTTTTGTTGTGTTTTGTTTGTGTGTVNTFNPFHIFNFTGGEQAINVPGSLGNGNVFSIIGSRTNPQFQVTLAALLNSRLTKILSEPQILAVNNKEAMIDVSTHFSYITDLQPVTTTTAVGNGTATQAVSAFVPQFDTEEVGFTLVVTPSVGRDMKTINLHLSPIIDTLAQGQQITQFQQFDVSQNNSQTPPVIQRPTIDQTSLETDVVLEDNGYVIIGGLLRNQNEVRERKIPGLYKIPILGNLFQTKSSDVTRSNLMIIVEAQIITPSGRTFYKCKDIDDVDPREGGVIRAPGQTSEFARPDLQTDERPAWIHPLPGTPPHEIETEELLTHGRSKPGQAPAVSAHHSDAEKAASRAAHPVESMPSDAVRSEKQVPVQTVPPAQQQPVPVLPAARGSSEQPVVPPATTPATPTPPATTPPVTTPPATTPPATPVPGTPVPPANNTPKPQSSRRLTPREQMESLRVTYKSKDVATAPRWSLAQEDPVPGSTKPSTPPAAATKDSPASTPGNLGEAVPVPTPDPKPTPNQKLVPVTPKSEQKPEPHAEVVPDPDAQFLAIP